ncbi:hypothetical protein Pint_17452 [Pistacia integerrima]|uniref:Uncharacterized protein n=1 Tax=Pistacia integerrima TaxID=434235 RepID=A0ACC0Z0W1_9ROSI|nr:hypothetical protein Pint_17452 [Pistacia integerrima]
MNLHPHIPRTQYLQLPTFDTFDLPKFAFVLHSTTVIMASNLGFKTLAVLLAVTFFVQGTLGEITCENLDQETCAYAVSSSGNRCVLEKRVKRSGEEAYTCGTSEIKADKSNNHIETDKCISDCGLDRKVLGISSDSLLESKFTQKLCSSQCYDNCPNIVDLYFNLAAGEGVFLPKLCEARGKNVRREMSEIRSSGFTAAGPAQAVKFLSDPVLAPAAAPRV